MGGLSLGQDNFMFFVFVFLSGCFITSVVGMEKPANNDAQVIFNQFVRDCATAIYRQDENIVIKQIKESIDAGANLNILIHIPPKQRKNHYMKNNKWTLLHVLIARGYQQAVRFLLSKKIAVNISDEKGITPIHLVGSVGDISLLIALLNSGADITALSSIGNIFHLVAWYNPDVLLFKTIFNYIERRKGHEIALNMLNYKDNSYGSTPLHFVVDRLCKKLSKFKNNHTILSQISFFKNRNDCLLLCELLCNLGADVNAVNSKGNAIIHIVVKYDLQTFYNFFVRCHADINARDREGCTVLHYAARHSQLMHYITLLLDAGAQFSVYDNNHFTPLDAARNNKEATVILKTWRYEHLFPGRSSSFLSKTRKKIKHYINDTAGHPLVLARLFARNSL